MRIASLMDPLREKVRNWALRRQGTDRLPLLLTPRRVYILPTGAGWNFALLILAMFVAGMNYGNGLVLLLTFWMTGFALVAMIQTQRSLSGAIVLHAGADPVFAGGKMLLGIGIQCRMTSSDLVLDGTGAVAGSSSQTRPAIPGVLALQLEFPALRRGLWSVPVLRVETHSPFGLFRTWTWLRLDSTALIYPRPEGETSLPESADPSGTRQRLSGNLDELAGLRNFRESDSPRQVAWKAYARGAPLLVREYQDLAGSARIFDYETLPHRDAEARLSQLSRWIVDSAALNLSWTLRLPGAPEICGSGATHRRRCLEALALFNAEPDR